MRYSHVKQRKFISVLQLFLVLSFLLLGGLAKNVYASPSNVRIAGQNRYQTAVAIAKQGWIQSDYAVLAYGENFPDALAAAPLAAKYNAPILLTGNSALTPETKQALVDLQVKHVFIVGGEGVVSLAVQKAVTDMGIDVTRLAGQDRYDTAIRIAQQLGSASSIAVATGNDYADALSIGSLAGKLGMPIILVPQNDLPDSIRTYLASQSINHSYVIGDQSTISDSVVSQLPNAERITGSDKFERNIAVLNKFSSDYNYDTVFLATGNNFADALTGTAYAAKLSAPIILLPSTVNGIIQNYLGTKLASVNNLDILGGEGAVPSSLVNGYLSYSQGNPAPLNVSQTINIDNYVSKYTARMTVEQIIRGDQAWNMIHAANQFNDPPKDGYEYVLAKIKFELLDIDAGKSLSLNGAVDIDAVSENGRVYDYASVVCPEPELDATLYKGASNEGWVAFMVQKNDLHPRLVYGQNYDGTGGIWFRAY